MQEVEPPFRPPGARKTAETARFGPPAGTEILIVLPLGIVRIDEKKARYGPFFAGASRRASRAGWTTNIAILANIFVLYA